MGGCAARGTWSEGLTTGGGIANSASSTCRTSSKPAALELSVEDCAAPGTAAPPADEDDVSDSDIVPELGLGVLLDYTADNL